MPAFALLLAAALVDPAVLDRKVAAFTGADIGEPGGAQVPVDRRLKLAECGAQIEIAWHGSRRDAIALRCPDPGGWHIFVPVLLGSDPLAPASLARSAPETVSPPVIRRGDAVSILLEGRGFSISRPAEALEEGAPGEWIRVRALTDRQAPRPGEMRARVVRGGLVVLPVGG